MNVIISNVSYCIDQIFMFTNGYIFMSLLIAPYLFVILIHTIAGVLLSYLNNLRLAIKINIAVYIQEIVDVTEEYNRDRRDLELTQEELLKELKLKYLIIENFIPGKILLVGQFCMFVEIFF